MISGSAGSTASARAGSAIGGEVNPEAGWIATNGTAFQDAGNEHNHHLANNCTKQVDRYFFDISKIPLLLPRGDNRGKLYPSKTIEAASLLTSVPVIPHRHTISAC